MLTMTKQRMFTTRQAGEEVGAETWKVRRLFEDGTLPEPGKFGGKRVIPESLIPAIREAMRRRGWIPTDGEAVAR